MTNEGVYAEVDASNIYSQGQAFQVVSVPINMYGIKLKNKGAVPDALSGSYTAPKLAVRDIHDYMAKRQAHFEQVERKKNAKVTPKKQAETKTEE